MECTRLRVKNVPFDRHQLIVRDGQGGKDRITLLPEFTESHGNGADGTLANGLAPVAGICTQFAPITYNAGRKKHHVNLRPAL
jgi:hypothetical protein